MLEIAMPKYEIIVSLDNLKTSHWKKKTLLKSNFIWQFEFNQHLCDFLCIVIEILFH